MESSRSGPAACTLGFAGTPDEALTIWRGAAKRWMHVVGRPTAREIAAYRELSSGMLAGRVLILGVTPELRDLAADSAPVVLDMSRAMYDATTGMLRDADPARETWIEGDWCNAGRIGTFDLIIGDMIWWTLSVANQRDVRDAVHRALAPGGLFVGRLRLADRQRRELEPVPAVARYLERLEQGVVDAHRAEWDLLCWLYDHTADYDSQRLRRSHVRGVLLELASLPRFNLHREFLETATTRLVGADWTSQTRDQLFELLHERFVVAGERHSGEGDSFLRPVVALRPR